MFGLQLLPRVSHNVIICVRQTLISSKCVARCIIAVLSFNIIALIYRPYVQLDLQSFKMPGI